MFVGPDSVAPRDSAPPPSGGTGGRVPGDPKVTQAHREREQAQAPWAQLTTVPAPLRPVKAGSLTLTITGQRSPTGADDIRVNDTPLASIPGRRTAFPGVPGEAARTLPAPPAVRE